MWKKKLISKLKSTLTKILPAINLAICWKLLYNDNYISQSAGNLGIETYGILRDYTPEYFNYKILSLPFFCRSIYTHTTKDSDDTIQTLPFSSYFTGLVEGDGTIIVPNSLRSKKGKLNYPSIQIVFHLKDLPLALVIQKELGLGSLYRKKGINAYVLSINSYEGLYKIVSIINGNMRTPKIHSLYKLIDFLNNSKQTKIIKKVINNNSLDSNAWLSGFIEADGSFQVRTSLKSKYPKYECKIEICQRRTDHNNHDNLKFLKPIATLFNTEVKETRSNKPWPEYRVRTTNVLGNINVKNYLTNYPLFGTKHLDSIDWMVIIDMFVKNEHKVTEGKNKIVDIKSSMNDRRTIFTWNHLQKFYNLRYKI